MLKAQINLNCPHNFGFSISWTGNLLLYKLNGLCFFQSIFGRAVVLSLDPTWSYVAYNYNMADTTFCCSNIARPFKWKMQFSESQLL